MISNFTGSQAHPVYGYGFADNDILKREKGADCKNAFLSAPLYRRQATLSLDNAGEHTTSHRSARPQHNMRVFAA